MKIEEIDSRDSMFDVAAAGNVVSVRPGSGIISRCPECGRVVQKASCRVHGKVEGIRDMRIKAVLDDGTGVHVSYVSQGNLQKLSMEKPLKKPNS